MYSEINFKTKKAFREAVVSGRKIHIYQPGGIFDPPEAQADYTGKTCVEGPHYPMPHTWYAQVEMRDGIVVHVK